MTQIPDIPHLNTADFLQVGYGNKYGEPGKNEFCKFNSLPRSHKRVSVVY